MTTPLVTIDPRTAPPRLREFLDAARARVDTALEHRLAVPARDPGRLRAAMHYAATGPGKRLRPALVLAAAAACGGDDSDALPAAVAIELLHAYTLVHDDLPAMDDDDERRGRPTVHIAFGEAIAILAGDGLLTQAFACLAELGPRAGAAVATLAARAGADELLAGQAIDLAMGSAPADLAAVEDLHAKKTGALFAAAAELGAIAAGAPDTTRATLARYGLAIGIAFQHADDRDDGERPEQAAAATARAKLLGAEAAALATSLGPSAQVLVELATWIGG
ncbi:MAG: polyprenyl synthetase family protein [Kofleriaceae bacterium]